MWAAIASAAAGLASGVYGAIKSAQAAKEQKQLINRQAEQTNDWYRRNYYGDYLDSVEGRAAINRVKETMRDNNARARARAAITGGTNEDILADNEANNKMMSDTVSNLAQQGAAQKRNVDIAYQNKHASVNQQQTAQAAADETGASQYMGNGLGLIATALQSIDGGKKS